MEKFILKNESKKKYPAINVKNESKNCFFLINTQYPRNKILVNTNSGVVKDKKNKKGKISGGTIGPAQAISRNMATTKLRIKMNLFNMDSCFT
ncbi:MAG: hypothetical protein WBM53_17660 [Maribacter sp.]